ncbi:MAG: hypothetical protein IKU86_06630 [Thermoguttaceae bacterium]|nr:hypothetical protein [Thermoguttaceae bacterium]
MKTQSAPFFPPSGAFADAVQSSQNAPPYYIPFERGRFLLRDADLLLVRSGGVVPWLGRGVHGHVATVARWNSEPFVLETRPGGGRAVPLDAFLRRNPRRVDVFRPNPDGRWPEYRPERCVAFLRRALSARYGWRSVFAAAFARLPGTRRLWGAAYFDDAKFADATSRFPETCASECLDAVRRLDRERPRRASFHCAEARALADRWAGVDAIPFLSDRFVEPADLARSPFYRYQFTFAAL